MKIAYLLLIVSLNISAADTWKEDAHKLLPEPLKSFVINKTTVKEVEEKLGKATLVEASKYYWEQEGIKYALELIFNEKKELKSIYYTFTGAHPSLYKLEHKIDLTKLKPYPKDGKSAGRFYQFAEKNVELIIDPISKTITRIKIL